MSCQAPGNVNHTIADPSSSTTRPSIRIGRFLAAAGDECHLRIRIVVDEKLLVDLDAVGGAVVMDADKRGSHEAGRHPAHSPNVS